MVKGGQLLLVDPSNNPIFNGKDLVIDVGMAKTSIRKGSAQMSNEKNQGFERASSPVYGSEQLYGGDETSKVVIRLIYYYILQKIDQKDLKRIEQRVLVQAKKAQFKK